VIDIETIMLTEAEMEMARRLAFQRNDSKKNLKGDYNMTGRDQEQSHFDGVRAEIAACKRFNYPVDTGIYIGGDDGRPDLYVGNYSVEVKAATYKPPILKFNTLTDFKSDVAILALVYNTDKMKSVVELWGCVGKHKFYKEHKIENYGYGPRAIMQAEQMSPIKMLDKYL